MRAPARLRAEWTGALSAVWLPALVSRALVWVAGAGAAQVRSSLPAFDPVGVTAGLSHAENVLAAPAARWDAIWYLEIARHGYAHSSPDFFPLYPFAVRLVAFIVRSQIVAGVLVSLVAFVVALCVVYRLVELDFGQRIASATVWILALLPMSLFFSAIYTESMFLALTAGSLYCARRGRWVWAGVLGGLAATTRSLGLLVVAPLTVIWCRERRVRGAPWLSLAWIALVPVGLLAYAVGLAIDRGTPLGMFDSKAASRAFVLAPVTLIRQLDWSADKFQQLGAHALVRLSDGVPELLVLLVAVVAAVAMARQKRHAEYTVYTIATLIVLLCEPAVRGQQPLTSFTRYMLVLFPVWIWVAVLAVRHRRGALLLGGLSAIALAWYTAQFATWRFVG